MQSKNWAERQKRESLSKFKSKGMSLHPKTPKKKMKTKNERA